MNSNHEWWERRYLEGSTPWDLGAPAGPLLEALDLLSLEPPLKVLFPGCGRGHDAIAFARRGFEVTAFDAAPSAIAAAREMAAAAGQTVDFLVADFFDLPHDWHSHFDAIVEHTFLVALEPALRPDYVRVVHELLVPGGRLLGLFFPLRPIGEGGPPYAIEESEVEKLYRGKFELRWTHPPTRSAPSRAGNEILALFQRA